ncbi:unnamed protein product [Clonostachys solani]|uniref:Uncharacterized protein n=1 Tax=Clonostachys solani TaxID=160281 RepID=A0A9N9Z2R8_9HYPO|nr:unnamed protein product [Clonostachys solani]
MWAHVTCQLLAPVVQDSDGAKPREEWSLLSASGGRKCVPVLLQWLREGQGQPRGCSHGITLARQEQQGGQAHSTERVEVTSQNINVTNDDSLDDEHCQRQPLALRLRNHGTTTTSPECHQRRWLNHSSHQSKKR